MDGPPNRCRTPFGSGSTYLPLAAADPPFGGGSTYLPLAAAEPPFGGGSILRLPPP